jgi:protein SCO1/2
MTTRTSQILLILSAFLTGLVVFTGVFLYATGNLGGSNPCSSAIVGPFKLVDQNGTIVTDAYNKGRPFLVFF